MAMASRFARTTLTTLSGVLIWGAHFVLIYTLTAQACAHGFADLAWLGVGVLTWVIGAATLLAAGLCLWLAVRSAGRLWRAGSSREEPAAFVDWLTASISALALMAVILESLPVLLVPACA